MRKQIFYTFFFIVFFVLKSMGQNEDEINDRSSVPVNINLGDDDDDTTDTDKPAVLLLDSLWKTKKGDDMLWASPTFDDSSWKKKDQDSILRIDNMNAITWFRIPFTADSVACSEPLALSMTHYGTAAEIYLDGKLIANYGKVGNSKNSEEAVLTVESKPVPFLIQQPGRHVFAIRFSNFHASEAKIVGITMGKKFTFSVDKLSNDYDDITDPSRYSAFVFYASIFITLAVVHFLFFIFYRQNIINLYYSLYCLGIFVLIYFIFVVLTSSDFQTIMNFSKPFRFIMGALFIPLVAMLHKIFYGYFRRIFWVIVIIYAAALIAAIFGFYSLAKGLMIATLFTTFVEIIRVIFVSVRKRKDGAWIFAMVLLLAPGLSLVCSMLPHEINLFGSHFIFNKTPIVIGSLILGLPFSMTLYLARDFARMNKKLKVQIDEITTLSEKALHQETEKKQILENLNNELEDKVILRTQEVMQQKELVEIKNKEITESVIYAKRIQAAILPDIKLMYRHLEQSFVLYIPKDIVSGDFYGFVHKEDKIIIAAADCTGHGVAGAFMSVIGSSMFNQIINEKNITQPAAILDALNDGIIDSLPQKESDSNDGMDVSILAFDLNKRTVDFAGANRPMWLIRNGELLTYKPNKFPIGGMQIIHEEKFSQHHIQLQPNDTIYIFSDGYADQFGGEHGKKLMTKRFKEILVSIQHLSMLQQQLHLKRLFEKWKGQHSQVDDVLVIGIKIP